MKPLIPLVLTLITLPLCAQNAPTPTKPKPAVKAASTPPKTTKPSRTASRRVVLPPSSRTQTNGVPTRPGNTSSRDVRIVTTPAGLQENITIQLMGSTQTGDALDLSLTGIGPVFQGDVSIGKESSILTHTYSVVPQGSSYLVEFSIGMRVRHITGTSGQKTHYEFRDNLISGKVLLEPGKPVTVSNNQGKVLALTVSKP